MGAVARRPHPSLRALLFRCGERALCEPWRLEDRSWRPWPAGPVRPSRPCCFGMAIAPCVSFGGWKTGQTASFLAGSESNVRQWGPWPAGPVRPSGPCCFGVASAPCLSLGGWKTGRGGRGPHARSVLQGPAVWLWRRRRFRSDSYFSCRFRKQR